MRACLVSESDLTLVCQHILAAGFDPREDERQRKSRRPNCSLLTRQLPAIHPALRRGVFVLSHIVALGCRWLPVGLAPRRDHGRKLGVRAGIPISGIIPIACPRSGVVFEIIRRNSAPFCTLVVLCVLQPEQRLPAPLPGPGSWRIACNVGSLESVVWAWSLCYWLPGRRRSHYGRGWGPPSTPAVRRSGSGRPTPRRCRSAGRLMPSRRRPIRS